MSLHPLTASPENPASSCCMQPKMWKYGKALEMVSCVAISTFALMQAPIPFLISVGIGAAYQGVRIYFNLSKPEDGGSRPGCGQGFGEQFSGVAMTPYEVIALTSFVFWRHLMHDPIAFVPLFGGFLGMRLVHHLHQRLHQSQEQQPKSDCCSSPG